MFPASNDLPEHSIKADVIIPAPPKAGREIHFTGR